MNPNLEELACLYVLDRLDERERAAFEARLLQDPELNALLGELEAELARRIHALPQHKPSAGALAGIEAQINRLPEREARPAARAAASRWVATARWGIAAVIAVSVGIIAVQSLRRPPAGTERPFLIVVGLDSLKSTLAELPVQEHPRGADASFIQLASLAEKFWDKPEELPVKMGSADQTGLGYALFDPGSNQGFIAIRRLPAVEPGMQYHLWILDTKTGQVRQAGVLPAGSSAHGLYFFSAAPDAGARLDRLDLFVTAEDAADPDSAQPRGKVVLGDRRI
jgi:hypothetical protein